MTQFKVGKVISTKMQKTVVVEVEMRKIHPLYKKIMRRSKRIKAHDELGVKAGQKVKIAKTKPFAKSVHFRVTEVIS